MKTNFNLITGVAGILTNNTYQAGVMRWGYEQPHSSTTMSLSVWISMSEGWPCDMRGDNSRPLVLICIPLVYAKGGDPSYAPPRGLIIAT